MIFEATFLVKIGGVDKKITGDIYDKQHAIRINDKSQGRLVLENGKWRASNNEVTPHADLIIAHFNSIRQMFKWQLPNDLRRLILWAKYNFDTNELLLAIDDFQNSFEVFEGGLKEALKAQNIIPSAKIKLHMPRRLSSYEVKI